MSNIKLHDTCRLSVNGSVVIGFLSSVRKELKATVYNSKNYIVEEISIAEEDVKGIVDESELPPFLSHPLEISKENSRKKKGSNAKYIDLKTHNVITCQIVSSSQDIATVKHSDGTRKRIKKSLLELIKA